MTQLIHRRTAIGLNDPTTPFKPCAYPSFQTIACILIFVWGWEVFGSVADEEKDFDASEASATAGKSSGDGSKTTTSNKTSKNGLENTGGSFPNPSGEGGEGGEKNDLDASIEGAKSADETDPKSISIKKKEEGQINAEKAKISPKQEAAQQEENGAKTKAAEAKENEDKAATQKKEAEEKLENLKSQKDPPASAAEIKKAEEEKTKAQNNLAMAHSQSATAANDLETAQKASAQAKADQEKLNVAKKETEEAEKAKNNAEAEKKKADDELEAAQSEKPSNPARLKAAREAQKKRQDELKTAQKDLEQKQAAEKTAQVNTETKESLLKKNVEESKSLHAKNQAALESAQKSKDDADADLIAKRSKLAELKATGASKDDIKKAQDDVKTAEEKSKTANKTLKASQVAAQKSNEAYEKSLQKSMTAEAYQQHVADVSTAKSEKDIQDADAAQERYHNSQSEYEKWNDQLKEAQQATPPNKTLITQLKVRRDLAQKQMKNDETAYKMAQKKAKVSEVVAVESAGELQDKMQVITTKKQLLSQQMLQTQTQLDQSNTDLVAAQTRLTEAQASLKGGTGSQNDVDQAQSNFDRIQQKNNKLKQQMNDFQSQKDTLEKDTQKYNEARTEYADLQARYAAAQDERKNYEQEVEKTQKAFDDPKLTAPTDRETARLNLEKAKAQLSQLRNKESELMGNMEKVKGRLYSASKNRQDRQEILKEEIQAAEDDIERKKKRKARLETSLEQAIRSGNTEGQKSIEAKLAMIDENIKQEQAELVPIKKRMEASEFDDGYETEEREESDLLTAGENIRSEDPSTAHADYRAHIKKTESLFDEDVEDGASFYSGEPDNNEDVFYNGRAQSTEFPNGGFQENVSTEWTERGGGFGPAHYGADASVMPNYNNGGNPLGDANYGNRPLGNPDYRGNDVGGIGGPNYSSDGLGGAYYGGSDLPWVTQSGNLYQSNPLESPRYQSWEQDGRMNPDRLTSAPQGLSPLLMLPKDTQRQFTQVQSVQRRFDPSAPNQGGGANMKQVQDAKMQLDVAQANLTAAQKTWDPIKIAENQLRYDERLIQYDVALNQNSPVGVPLERKGPGWWNSYGVPERGFTDAQSGGIFEPTPLTSEKVTQFIDTGGAGILSDHVEYTQKLPRAKATVEEGKGFEILNPRQR